MAHTHDFKRSKPDATVETCACGKFRFTEHAGPSIVEERAPDIRWAVFNGAELSMTLEQARIGSHQGQCDDDVAYLLTVPEIAAQLDKIGHAALAAELREYGAWSDEELADEQATRARFVWLACGNICEEEA